MLQGRVIHFSESIALSAARISLERKIPMADSIIAATGAEFGATIWTQDADFEDLPGVKFIVKNG
jgi:predicted nucleic acid-binding protein